MLHYLLGKGGYVFGRVGLSVCLFVCLPESCLKVTDLLELIAWWRSIAYISLVYFSINLRQLLN